MSGSNGRDPWLLVELTGNSVEDCDSRITNENDDDESGSWTEVVSKKKKKTDGFLTTKKKKTTDGFLTTNLGGKQSEKRFEKLTLFTKSN